MFSGRRFQSQAVPAGLRTIILPFSAVARTNCVFPHEVELRSLPMKRAASQPQVILKPNGGFEASQRASPYGPGHKIDWVKRCLTGGAGGNLNRKAVSIPLSSGHCRAREMAYHGELYSNHSC